MSALTSRDNDDQDRPSGDGVKSARMTEAASTGGAVSGDGINDDIRPV
jgi:hypothetical protein